MPITDPNFFENTHPATIRASYKNTTDPHQNQENQIQGKLLLIVKLSTSTHFIYETYNIITNKNKIIDVKPKTDRDEKPNDQIIEEHINFYKDKKVPHEILAYNPNEYTQEKIISDCI